MELDTHVLESSVKQSALKTYWSMGTHERAFIHNVYMSEFKIEMRFCGSFRGVVYTWWWILSVQRWRLARGLDGFLLDFWLLDICIGSGIYISEATLIWISQHVARGQDPTTGESKSSLTWLWVPDKIIIQCLCNVKLVLDESFAVKHA